MGYLAASVGRRVLERYLVGCAAKYILPTIYTTYIIYQHHSVSSASEKKINYIPILNNLIISQKNIGYLYKFEN